MSRIMLAAMSSGSGKTTVTWGLLAALRDRGVDVRAFKCGPDYIDPMFHTRLLGIPGRNLDLFLQGERAVKRTLSRHGGSLAVLEGAMGFYDGVGGTHEASAWDVANRTSTPVILVVCPGGSSLTLAAQVKGLRQFRRASRLAGIILNRCTPRMYGHLTPILQKETGLPVLGYLPPMEEAVIPSRHLGLLTAGEVEDFTRRSAALGQQVERTVDLDRVLTIARGVRPLPPVEPYFSAPPRCVIAVARDEAFCFYYADSLEALEEAGAQLAFFSPLRDKTLPEGVQGLYLGGGYPELYARQLSENSSMRRSIMEAISAGMPTVAECGGFLYLQQSLEDPEKKSYPMVGFFSGKGSGTGALRRFGYITLSGEQESMLFRPREQVPAHEFHHWDTDCNGESLEAVKASGQGSWRCAFTGENLYAGFPHLHLGGKLPLAARFADTAARWQPKKEGEE
ncbi:cobyrinate a,c-diamide synthase [Angelakisella massiliensis]|uniref:cobyrinate a,c-diamide synthase n=1 Tax=Angelakisella massiliensis TaxID=1871018 RepID=UPI0024B0D133|nr:cobyrinate a,c-diamide synthase [Angelakisella massiliensis]